MSFNLTTRLSLNNRAVSPEGKDAKSPSKEAAAASKTRGLGKKNLIATAKTDDYVDDGGLYEPKFKKEDRLVYFQFLLDHVKTKRKGKGGNMDTWLAMMSRGGHDEVTFPTHYKKILRVVRSAFWDHLYLGLFIVWLLLIVLFYDGFADQLLPSLKAQQQSILMYPLIGMLMAAVIPCLGTAYFVHSGNDLIRFMASKDFGRWSFPSVLTGQYVEYFYYGGRGMRSLANNVALENAINNHKRMKEFLGSIAKSSLYLVKLMRKRGHAKVKPNQNENNSEDEDEDEDQEQEDDDEEEEEEEEGDIEAGKTPNEEKEKKKEKEKKRKQSDTDNHSHSQSQGLEGESLSLVDDASLDTIERELMGEPIEMVEWTCIVCKTFNPSTPKVPTEPPKVDLYFGVRGVYYKHTYTNLVWRPNKPVCQKCSTPYDYKPPLSSAHMFPHNPDPYRAFKDYPEKAVMLHGLKDGAWQRYLSGVKSLFYGMQDSRNAHPMENDWKLKKWILHTFPPIPRYELKADERYELGEIVESRQQRSEFCRARIVNVRANGSYDICYDSGDQVRFLLPHQLRLGAEKGAFAYRVEICMVGLYIFFPLGLLLSVMQQNASMVFIGPMVVGTFLLVIRLDNLIQYIYNYSNAGLCHLFRATTFFTLPVFFLFLFGVVGMSSGSNLPSASSGIAVLFILMFLFSLPVLYVMRPHFAVLALIVLSQPAIGLIMLSMYFANPKGSFPYLAIPLVPFLTMTLTLHYLRVHFHALWDVSLVIRPASNQNQKESAWWALFVVVKKFIVYYLP